MKILILYGTTEGQTRKVACFLAQRLTTRGHDGLTVDAEHVPADLDVNDFDGVMVAASLHLGRYQPLVVDFVRRNVAKIDRRPSAFLSVSLATISLDQAELDGLDDCVRRFIQETRWTPGYLHHVGGAFRFSAYDFFRRWAMKYVAYQHGIPVEPGQDREFTDWTALGQFADKFIAEAARPALVGYPGANHLGR